MKRENSVFDDIRAENLTVNSVIVEGRIDPEKPFGVLKRPFRFYRVLEFSQQGHEVHVVVQPTTANAEGRQPKLNWCYQAEARVFVQ